MKNISFLSEKYQFLEMKFSIYLNRRVFVMLGLFTLDQMLYSAASDLGLHCFSSLSVRILR